jgi:hypothetical protein
MKPGLLASLVAFITAFSVGTALAQDTGMCAPRAGGVPFWKPAAPKWREFGGAPATADCIASSTDATTEVTTDCHWDDPRWRGSAALAYKTASGSANPPVQFRTLWSPEGGRYLFVQWVVRVGIFGRPGNNHDLFFAFERPAAASLPIGHKRAHFVKLHISADSTTGLRNSYPIVCDPDILDGDTGACPSDDDHYSIYTNTQIDAGGGIGGPEVQGCGGFVGNGMTFRGRATGEPWFDGAIQIQRKCDGATCDLWTVSLRIPMIAADSSTVDPFSGPTGGIEEGSNFWYQVDLQAAAGSTARLDSWPRLDDAETENPTCRTTGSTQRYIQRDLDAAAGWSKLTLWDGYSTRPDDCFDGFSITPDAIGTLVRDAGTPAPADIITPSLDYRFKLYTSGTTRATNHVVARAINNGDPETNVQLKARFRFAQWGVQPWTTHGAEAVWSPVPGSTPTGVCSVAGSPTCGAIASVPVGGKVGMSFDWNIGGNDGTIDSLAEVQELCRYGLTPPNPPYSCKPCTLTSPDDGVQGFDGTNSHACELRLWDHQCMLVELDADSAVNFETQSIYKNMNIRQMSEVSREAVISVAGLPPIPGATEEEIYLVVMPRNISAVLPGGTTGMSLVQKEAAQARDNLMRPYREAAKVLTPEQYRAAAEMVRARDFGGAGYGGLSYGGLDPAVYEAPLAKDFPQADLSTGVDLMPRGLQFVAAYLDGASRWSTTAETFTEQTIATLDDITATTIVPTLDVYAYRKGKSGALIPMTSFSLVVHHEGPLLGVTWEIDGALKISPNVFRVIMPLHHKRDIRVRVMAKESAGEKQKKGDEKWPCPPGGCCQKQCVATRPDVAAVNFGLPMLAVGAVIMGRRRRKKNDAANGDQRKK